MSGGSGGPRINEYFQTKTDRQSSVLTFEGKARHDAATSDAVWQLKRTTVSGTVTTEEFADDGKFTQVYDNRSTAFPTPTFFNNGSLQFDGVNEYVDLGDNYDFGPATAFSWSMWMKANNFSAQRAMIAKTTQDANVYGYSFQHNSAGRLFTQFRAAGTLRTHTFTTVLSALTWYHIVFTYDGGSNMNGITAYINASSEGSPASASLNDWNHGDPLMFGRRGTTFHFSGNLNQITVWNKELSSSEVTELYNAGSPADPTGHSAAANLQSWWRLDRDDNFPTEVDQQSTINGTLINMESTDYIDGDIP